MKIFRGFDWVLFMVMIFLISFGIVVLLSASPNVARDQTIFAIFGFLLYFLSATFDFRLLKPFGYYIYSLNIFFLLVTLGFGVYSKGSIRWIPLGIGDFTLQPSEFMKLSLIIVLSSYLTSRFWRGSWWQFVASLFLALLPAALIVFQPDLGTAIVLLFIWLTVVFSARVRPAYLLTLLLVFAVSSPLLFFYLKPYQRERIATFVSPRLDPLGGGYHVLQSEIAVGSGQFLGRGFGRGTQSRLRFLPEFHTDFIFASLSEEWGFIGSLVVLLLFGVLLLKILRIATTSPFLFGQLFSLGIFAMIFIQVAINIGMNLGVAPITGIPLPLISSGGSSLVLTMLSLGLVQSVARESKKV